MGTLDWALSLRISDSYFPFLLDRLRQPNRRKGSYVAKASSQASPIFALPFTKRNTAPNQRYRIRDRPQQFVFLIGQRTSMRPFCSNITVQWVQIKLAGCVHVALQETTVVFTPLNYDLTPKLTCFTSHHPLGINHKME